MRILHITTHMGGGIGRAISDLTCGDYRNCNSILLLQIPEKTFFIERCCERDIEICYWDEISNLENMLIEFDLVIIHWWHHPRMCKFLYEFPNVDVRLVLWSHVSGCTYPFLNPQFCMQFDWIIITSLVTLENREWSSEEKNHIEHISSLVYGLGNLEHMRSKSLYEIDSDCVKIGYVGTLSKSKIHPQIVNVCKKIIYKLGNVEFYFVGDCEAGKWMQKEFKNSGILEYVKFVGYVENVNEWLRKFDIFGYPLNPYNYATTENAVLEAMATGVPVVMLNQGTEKYIVEDGCTGILANSIDDYVEKIVMLANNEELRKFIGIQAINDVYRKYDFNDNLDRFNRVVAKIMSIQKHAHSFRNIMGTNPIEWLKSAMNYKDKCLFERGEIHSMKDIFRENSKSSVYHFMREYPEDDFIV